jgi:hypothetical protein
MERVHIKDVVAILIKDPNVIRHKLRMCLELGISQTDYHQLDLRYSIGAITADDLFLEVFSKWASSQEKPLLTSCLDILVKCDFINVAGKTY